MQRINTSLSDKKAIFQIKHEALTPFDCLVLDFHHFKEVFVLIFVSIDFQDILKAVQKVIEQRLMLQYQKVSQVVDCAALMRQVFS